MTITIIYLRLDSFAPALVVQVSNRAIHELVGRPLQRHDVSSLVQREVTWDRLHVIPLKPQRRWMFGMEREVPGPSDICRQLPAGRARCFCQTAVWRGCFDGVTPRIHERTVREKAVRPCCCWSDASGSARYKHTSNHTAKLKRLRPSVDSNSHTVQASWWVNPVCSGLRGCDAVAPARQQKGLSRSGRLSSSWCTPKHKVPLLQWTDTGTVNSDDSCCALLLRSTVIT